MSGRSSLVMKSGSSSSLLGVRPASAGGLALFSFICPRKELRIPYKDQQLQLRKAMLGSTGFVDGCLLDTMEKGVYLPVIHYSNSQATVKRYFSTEDFESRDALGEDFLLQQGVYRESRSIIPNGQLSSGTPGENPMQGCIMVGYKSLDRSCDQVLENTWKDWTGARHIYLNLNSDFQLSRISLYHRIKPDNLDIFMYIVFAEIRNLNDRNHVHLLDFVQRMRVDRMSGYISVYRVFPLQGSIKSLPFENNQQDVDYSGSKEQNGDPITPSDSIKDMLREIDEGQLGPVKVDTY